MKKPTQYFVLITLFFITFFITAQNTPPTFTSMPVLSINDNQTYTYSITTNDTEGHEVNLTATTLPSWLALSTTVTVTTLAGNGSSGYLDGNAGTAIFNNPRGVAVDASGNIYVADGSNNRIRKITPMGVVSTLAGSGLYDFSDGTGATASFAFPIGIAIDASGNLYIGDSGNNRIRKITPAGVVTTLAGSTQGFADGTGAAAQFDSPAGIDIDALGNVYVADANNNRIRKITPSGVVTTIAGTGAYGALDGDVALAQFNNPSGIAVDDFGNVYVADLGNFSIRKINGGVVSTFLFITSEDVAVDASGNVFAASGSTSVIYKITPEGAFSVLAGNGGIGDIDGLATLAEFDSPIGIATDTSGIIYVTDQNNQKIKKITTSTILSGDAAGQGGTHNVVLNADDGFGGKSNQNFTITVNDVTIPIVTVLDPANNATDVNSNADLVITFSENIQKGVGSIRIRRVLDDSVLETIPVSSSAIAINGNVVTITPTAHLPSDQYYIDIPSEAFQDFGPNFFAGIIDKTTWTFEVRTNNDPSFTSSPNTAVDDNATYVYYLTTNDVDGDAVRITSSSIPAWITVYESTRKNIITISGSGSFGSNDGIGTAAQFDFPTDICVDSNDNLFVTDKGNNKIRKITPDGVVTTFAGSGTAGDVDGTGTAAQLNSPSGICIDTFDNLFVVDNGNNKIKKITPDGVVTTIAGSGTSGDVDGTCTDAQFSGVSGICIDPNNDLFLTDTNNNKIKKITTSSTCTVSTVAGSGMAGFLDGNAMTAQFDHPSDVCLDSSNNLLVCDQFNNKIRKISTTGSVTSYGDVGGVGGYYDGTINTGYNDPVDTFDWPTGIAIDDSDNIFITDQRNNKVKKISATDVLSTYAGTGANGSFDGIVEVGFGDVARTDYPVGIEVDSHGNVFITEQSFSKVRKIVPGGSAVLIGDATGQAGTYTITLQADDNFGNVPVQQSFDLAVTDVTPPTVTTFVPVDGTTGVTSSDLQIEFSEQMVLGTGDIVVVTASDGKPLGTIPVGTPGFIDFVNASFKSAITTNVRTTVTMKIGQFLTLPSNTDIAVHLPNTAFLDMSGKSYAGISDNTTWNFTTGTVLVVKDNIIKGFAMYPNPTKDSFRIITQEQILELEVYNLLGQLLKYQQVNNAEATVNVEKLAVGTYFVKIRTIKSLESVKLIKE